jgi:hypothetical protein
MPIRSCLPLERLSRRDQRGRWRLTNQLLGRETLRTPMDAGGEQDPNPSNYRNPFAWARGRSTSKSARDYLEQQILATRGPDVVAAFIRRAV